MKYTYQPLNPDKDSLRLIDLEHTLVEDAPVKCRLVEIPFSQVPRYMALSYTWGDMKITSPIVLDGIGFEVGESLFDALKHFRKSVRPALIWADAICINQQDIPERNRQIRLMPHIYTRAEVVLIWLHVPLATQNRIRVLTKSEEQLEEFMFEILSVHSYWQRVWIIQEIYNARKIIVASNESGFPSMSWEIFIDKLRAAHIYTSSENVSPLKFAEELSHKYEHSQNLLSLLQNYRRSRCKDPRDKIYGLIGLASDCYGFPIDYSKSTYEVWKDTMVFMTCNNMVEKLSIIALSRLVKNRLGCQRLGPAETNGEYITQTEDPKNNSTRSESIKLTLIVVGVIVHIGPTLERVIAELCAVDEWSASIYSNFSQTHGVAREESDFFLQQLEALDDTLLMRISVPDESVDDTLSITRGRTLFTGNYENLFKEHERTKRIVNVPMPTMGQALDSDYQLFQHKDTSRKQKFGRMGLGSGRVKTGDFICRAPLLDRAIIVRRSIWDGISRIGGDTYQFVGTALLSVDLKHSEKDIEYPNDQLDIMLDPKSVFDLAD